MVANTPMDTDKIKIYGARVSVDSFEAVQALELAEKEKMKQKVCVVCTGAPCTYSHGGLRREGEEDRSGHLLKEVSLWSLLLPSKPATSPKPSMRRALMRPAACGLLSCTFLYGSVGFGLLPAPDSLCL